MNEDYLSNDSCVAKQARAVVVCLQVVPTIKLSVYIYYENIYDRIYICGQTRASLQDYDTSLAT